MASFLKFTDFLTFAWNRKFYWFLILISAFSNRPCYTSPNGSDTLRLRIFPGIENYRINAIDVASSDVAVAYGTKVILYWNGAAWLPIKPEFPVKDPEQVHLKIFSPDNIWVFCQPHPKIYHTQIWHFNGQKWTKIPAPQPGTLKQFAFLNENQFWAGGDWGSLIFFDGSVAINIKAPRFAEIVQLSAITASHVIAGMKMNKHHESVEIYEYLEDVWKKLATFENGINGLYFNQPESGICFHDSIMSVYKNGVFEPRDTIPEILGGQLIHYQDDKYFISNYGKIYSYQPGRLELIYQLEFPVHIFPISENSFFLTDERYHGYYWGAKHFGDIVPPSPKSIFELQSFSNAGSTSHLGLALYSNKFGEVDIYFTSPNGPNIFYTKSIENAPLDIHNYEDVMFKRSLLGYAQERQENTEVWDAGFSFADIDNDGDADALMIALQGKNKLYENIGNDQFRDISEDSNFSLMGRILAISWCDLNLDGNLDFAAGDGNGPLTFYRGNGAFQFLANTQNVILSDTLYARMPSFADIDNDGDLDLLLYSAYDNLMLYKNTGINPADSWPKFIDVSNQSPELTKAFDFFTQSVAWGDYDNDGDLDIFLANRHSGLKLFNNNGQGIFNDVSIESGVSKRFFAYGANWGDIDNDGYLDLFVTTLGKNYIYWNQSGQKLQIDSTYVDDNKLEYSTASSLVDLDHDGDLDLVVANSEIGRSYIGVNKINTGARLEVRVHSAVGNTDGIGAQVSIYDTGKAGNIQHLRGFRQISLNSGYISYGLPRASFGLSSEDQIYDVQVRFPSGKTVIAPGVKAGQSIVVQEPRTWEDHIKNIYLKFKPFFLQPGKRNRTFSIIIMSVICLLVIVYLSKYRLWQARHIAFYTIALISTNLFFVSLLNLDKYPIFMTFTFSGLAVFLFLIGHLYLTKKFQQTELVGVYNALRQFKHGQTGLSQIEHLMLLFNNFSALKDNGKIFHQTRQEASLYLNNTVPSLLMINRQVRQITLYLATTRAFVRNSRQAESIARKFVQRDCPPEEKLLGKYAGVFTNLRKDLLKITDEIEWKLSSPLIETVNDSLISHSGFTDISRQFPTEVELLRVIMPRHELAQAFDNLFQNSLEAMVDQDDKRVEISVKKPTNGQVMILISDNGPGILAGIQHRIFEKGFSTKYSTGIGLAHSLENLRRYGGDIELLTGNDKKLRGTTFKITLRIYTDEQTHNHHDR